MPAIAPASETAAVIPLELAGVLNAIRQAFPGRRDRDARVALIERAQAVATGQEPPRLCVVVPAATVALVDDAARKAAARVAPADAELAREQNRSKSVIVDGVRYLARRITPSCRDRSTWGWVILAGGVRGIGELFDDGRWIAFPAYRAAEHGPVVEAMRTALGVQASASAVTGTDLLRAAVSRALTSATTPAAAIAVRARLLEEFPEGSALHVFVVAQMGPARPVLTPADWHGFGCDDASNDLLMGGATDFRVKHASKLAGLTDQDVDAAETAWRAGYDEQANEIAASRLGW